MSYTINPNAKNGWVRNADNTMDLSIETDASSVYLDNGRTLEQEVGKGTMVSNVATVDSSMSKVIDGTLDGAYESCVLKGKSLVNISNKTQEIELLGRANTHTQIEIANKDLLKRNTKYILILGYDVTFDTNSPNKTLYLDDGHGYTYIKGLTKRNIVTDSGKGVFVSVITTKDEEKTNNSNIHITLFKGSDGNRVIISNLMLIEYQEGMENWDIPYFTGLCDVKMPILRNVGKNLFDINVYPFVDKVAYQEGNRVSWSGYRGITELFPVKPNTTYTFSNDLNKPIYFGIVFYDNNKTKVSYGHAERTTFTTPDNCAFIRFSIQSDVSPSWVQIEESSQQTTYEDYKTNILTTPEEVILRKVGDVCDSYDALTGEYVQRIGEVILDGSDDESWAIYTNNRAKTIQFRFDMKSTAKGQSDYTKIISSHLPSVDIINNNDIEGVSIYSNGNIYISLLRTKAETLSSLKSYLQSNPITVQYELAQPITTIIEPLTIPFAYENGHVILESGYEGQSLLPTLEYSTVIDKTGLVESVEKTIQKQEKQITKLEQMLIQNIIDLDYNNTLLILKNEMGEML